MFDLYMLRDQGSPTLGLYLKVPLYRTLSSFRHILLCVIYNARHMYIGNTPIHVVLNVNGNRTLHMRFNLFYFTPTFTDLLTERTFNL